MYRQKALHAILNAGYFLAKMELFLYNSSLGGMADGRLSEFPNLAPFSFFTRPGFQPGEKHVTRICSEDVLLLVFSGVLRFVEDGVPVEVHGGEYYIQKRGLLQQGVVPSDCPVYYYVHFSGTWSDESGIRKRGPLPGDIRALTAA